MTADQLPTYGQHYHSRGHAIRAGAWRGAKFGGKWMAATLTVISLVVWAGMIGFIVYRWLWDGMALSRLVTAGTGGPYKLLQMLGSTVGAIVVGTVWGAILGALIMGVAAAFDDVKPKQRFGFDDETEGEAPP